MSDFEARGKRVFFDGAECIDSWPVAMARTLIPILDETKELWMQETEGGDWYLILTRDAPGQPMRNPDLSEMVR